MRHKLRPTEEQLHATKIVFYVTLFAIISGLVTGFVFAALLILASVIFA